MKAYLTYALNQEGDLVHIDSVPNGNDCGCFCPHCKSELCAKNGGTGEKMVHHFAHLSGADCVGAVESALHKMAKDVMKEALCIQLPDRFDGRSGEQLKLERVDVELYDKETQLRPDCIGYYGDKVIWIEFKRTHAVDTKKRGKIISAKIDCIELDLNGCELDPENVRKFITEETERRKWIRDSTIKPRRAGDNRNPDYKHNRYDDYYYSKVVQRVFAKDENGMLVNLLDEVVDMNKHNYYCLACGKELTIDVDETGAYSFSHIDKDVHCEDDLYLHEAAKDILLYKFHSSDRFEILVPQQQNCSEKADCIFFNPELCSSEKNFTYDLKEYGYSECIKNFRVPGFRYNCDIVIKKVNTCKNAILFSINAGDCHIDVNTDEYRVIEIDVTDESKLLSLLEYPVGVTSTIFMNFTHGNIKTASRSEIDRKILKFSLFSSGKYYVDSVPCSKITEHKNSTVLEHIFVDGIYNKYDAKWYSLLKCHEQKRNACYCELCWFLKENDFYGMSERICTRYKTKGTPHYPLQTMPIDCPYFSIDKEIESMAKINYGNVKMIEKEFNK